MVEQNIQKDEILLLFIGRIHKIKGLDLLVDGFEELIKTNNGLLNKKSLDICWN